MFEVADCGIAVAPVDASLVLDVSHVPCHYRSKMIDWVLDAGE